jgi:glycosyltransferase involved in cell wall biosynthesis
LDKLKVALIGPDFLPNWGGIGTYNVRLTKYLMDKVEMHVIAAKRSFDGKNEKVQSKDIPESFIRNNVHFISNSKDTFLYNASFQRAVFKELPKLDKEYHFDVIHSNHAHMGDLLYKLEAKIPSVVTVHTTLKGQIESILQSSKLRLNDMDTSERYQILLSGFLLATERFYFKRSKNVTTVSNWMKNELEKSFHLKNIHVIYSGVEPTVFLPKCSNNSLLPEIEKPIVLFTSSMGPRKGSLILIEAMKQVLYKNRNVHFVFAGATSYQMHGLLRQNMIDENFYTVLGYVPYDLLPELYSRASIFVSPSLCDNLPARILEALSCEVPVIATNIAAIPEAINDGENGLLVPAGDSEALSKSICLLLNEPDLGERMGKIGRQTVLKKFSWDKLADQTKEVYELVANGSN